MNNNIQVRAERARVREREIKVPKKEKTRVRERERTTLTYLSAVAPPATGSLSLALFCPFVPPADRHSFALFSRSQLLLLLFSFFDSRSLR